MAQYAHPETLVDTQWLSEKIGDPSVRIIEVDMSPEACKDAHIPGAIFWNIFKDLLNPDLSMKLDQPAMESLMSRSGISRDTTVVAYGAYPDTGTWIFWLLKAFGHRSVYVLNGGYQKWMAENRPVAATFSGVEPTEYHASPLDNSVRVLLPEVRAAIAQPACMLLDVRTAQEYAGEIFMTKPPEGSERGGHIPGALHIEHTLSWNEDGTFKSADELHNLYTSYGVTVNKTIFPYCAIGGRSTSTWFVLRYLLGYPNVQNYDGSWNEWSRLPAEKVAQ